MTSTLVAYATKHGSTREVAEALAQTLRRLGHKTEVRAAADVDQLDGYDAVVLGGALYGGRWHKDAKRFLERHRDALVTVPLAVFAMGPKTMTPDDVASSRAQLDRALVKVPDIAPVAIAIFGGAVDPSVLSFPFNHMPASDARDWHMIEIWAEEIAQLTAERRAVAA